MHTRPIIGLFEGLFVFVLYFLFIPLVAGFVLGRLGRVVNGRYGPELAVLRDQDDH